ncbi:MAG TPA: NADH:flavin oxidoreductase [Bacteroidales bacterium]|nr:NADH:flavin oxidoreductase [Bacteroidales bacterium]
MLFTEYNLGPLRLRNRAIRAAAFEGMCPGNRVSDDLINYHASVAAGGTAMTTVAYAAVTRNGLSFPHQLLVTKESVPDLRRLTDAIHREGAAASIQLGHCGLMADRRVAGTCLSPSGGFNLYGANFHRTATVDEIREIATEFGRAVAIAREAGFDAVEIHAGHGYLISQFLSPYTNHRKDHYGGPLENRSRFMTEVMGKVMDNAGSGLAVVVKMNLRDGFKGGMELDESVEVARVLEKAGVHGLVLSGGFVSRAPMYVMRGKMPVQVMAHFIQNPFMRLSVACFAGLLIRPVPYREAYFLDDALEIRKEVNLPLILVGGLHSRDTIELVIEKGFSFIQMARPLIQDPGFIGKLKRGEVSGSACNRANYCIAKMYTREMRCHQNESNLPSRWKECFAKES